MSTPQDMQPGCIHQSKSYGPVAIIQYNNSRSVFVCFERTAAVVELEAHAVRVGQVKDPLAPSVYGVGFIGQGPHRARVEGKRTAAYGCWVNMLGRCYETPRRKVNAAYAGVTVCREWHNFQRFAEWYEATHPHNASELHELDKDRASHGAKIYSPETCQWLTRHANLAARDGYCPPQRELRDATLSH